MILLLGASGYIGRAYANELRRRGHSFIPLTRQAFDYSRFDFLFDYLRTMKPVFLINAASYRSVPQGTTAQAERDRMMAANAILPQMIARICLMTKTPWGHVSSGEIFSGGKVLTGTVWRTVANLSDPDLRPQFDSDPAKFRGFTESDEPNFTFRNNPCNFYSGTRALAEEAIRSIGSVYIWRPRWPFNDREEPCNLLSSLPRQGTVYDHINSISHLEDFIKATLDLWEIRAPFGVYNVTNPGAVTNRQIMDGLQRLNRSDARARISPPEEDPALRETETPKSNCILDVSKLLKAGIKMRPASEALKDSLERMRLATRQARNADSQSASSSLSA